MPKITLAELAARVAALEEKLAPVVVSIEQMNDAAPIAKTASAIPPEAMEHLIEMVKQASRDSVLETLKEVLQQVDGLTKSVQDFLQKHDGPMVSPDPVQEVEEYDYEAPVP